MGGDKTLEDCDKLRLEYTNLKEKFERLKNDVRIGSVLHNIEKFETKYKEGFNRMELEQISEEIPYNKKTSFNDVIIHSKGTVINNSLIVDRNVVITAVLNIIKDIDY